MPSVIRSIDVPLAPEQAFALVTDAGRFHEWLTLHSAWPQGAPASIAAGTTFTQTLKVMGMPADVDWTVESSDAPSQLVMRGGGPMGTTLVTTIGVVPSGGGSAITYEVAFSGALVAGPMGEMVTAKAGEEIQTSLAALAELDG